MFNELHIETTYNYLKKGNKISPTKLINFLKEEDVECIAIVDYLNLACMPTVENLRKENKIKTKIIYGITINIKIKDILVESIILAKNSEGLKALYKIISSALEDNFIKIEDLEKYLDYLILGLKKIPNIENNLLKDYTYIEIDYKNSNEEIKKINDFALSNNLLAIACSGNEFITKEKMIDKFIFLSNWEDLVINNINKISNMVFNYKLNDNNKYLIIDNYNLKEELYERAKLLYLDNVPSKIYQVIDEEVMLINKYHLEGTIKLIDKLIKKLQKKDMFVSIDSYFANTFTSYLLGWININPLQLTNRRSLEDDLKRYNLSFRINVSDEDLEYAERFLAKMLNGKLYSKSGYVKIEENVKDIARVPSTYYLVPKDTDIKDLTPIKKIKNNIYVCQFDYHFLDNYFVQIYLSTPMESFLLKRLAKKCKKNIFEIKQNDKKVLNNMINKKQDKANKYLSNYHYFVASIWTVKIKVENPNKINSLIDIIDSNNKEKTSWLNKCLRSYYLSFYKTYYPRIYYQEYLKYIINYFKLNDKVNLLFYENMIKLYKEKKLDNYIEQEKNQFLMLVEMIFKDMFNENIFDLTNSSLIKKIMNNKIIYVKYSSKKSDMIVKYVKKIAIDNKYKTLIISYNENSNYYNNLLISYISKIDFKLIRKYCFPYVSLAKNNQEKIDSKKYIKAIELIQNSPLQILKYNDDLIDTINDFKEDIIIIDDLASILKSRCEDTNEFIKKISKTNKHYIIFKKDDKNVKK